MSSTLKVVSSAPVAIGDLFDDDEVIRATRTLRLAHDAVRYLSAHGTAAQANQAFETMQEARRQWHRAVGIQL